MAAVSCGTTHVTTTDTERLTVDSPANTPLQWILTHLAPDQLPPCHPFATKSHAKGSNCVKGSWDTTLKINNKHQTKVSAHFVFFPVCE